MRFLIYCGLWLFSHYACYALEDIRGTFPDFETSLKGYGRSERQYRKKYREGCTLPYVIMKDHFKALYDFDRDRQNQEINRAKIPRIIHQIWLGGALPEKYKAWTQTWQNWEGWEYRLWTDEDVKNLQLLNRKQYDEAKDYGEKSDILRYEILYQCGGLYVDTDFECLNPQFFDFAHQEYSFYLGIEPLENDRLLCGNALLASTPGHPLIEKIVEELKNQKAVKRNHCIQKTGPRYLTNILYKHSELLGNDGLVFPPTFFYPVLKLDTLESTKFYKPESAAVHYWENSWVLPLEVISLREL